MYFVLPLFMCFCLSLFMYLLSYVFLSLCIDFFRDSVWVSYSLSLVSYFIRSLFRAFFLSFFLSLFRSFVRYFVLS